MLNKEGFNYESLKELSNILNLMTGHYVVINVMELIVSNKNWDQFRKELEVLINQNSIDTELNKPDHFLADFIVAYLRLSKELKTKYKVNEAIKDSMETLNYE